MGVAKSVIWLIIIIKKPLSNARFLHRGSDAAAEAERIINALWSPAANFPHQLAILKVPFHHPSSPSSPSFLSSTIIPTFLFPRRQISLLAPNQIAHRSRQNSSVSHLIVHYSCRLRLFRKLTNRKQLLTRPHATPLPWKQDVPDLHHTPVGQAPVFGPFASSTPSTTSIESTNNLQSSLNTVPPASTLSLVLPLASATL